MGVMGRRVWRTIGWRGILLLVCSLLFIGLLSEGGLTFSGQTLNTARPVLMLIVGLIFAGSVWGIYSRSVETAPYQQVLAPLLASHEEYCLLLRPFGSDGEVIIPHIRKQRSRFVAFGAAMPTMTMEQVVSAAARRQLGQAAYAMVDQDRKWAPPGPVYLRAPHAEWKRPAAALIRRAHTIAVVLPPKQDLRAALEWELQAIIRYRRQSRVVIVLPPNDRKEYGHSLARQQACVLLAALEGPLARIQDVPADRIKHYLDLVPEEVLVIKRRRDGGIMSWHAERRRWFGIVATSIYADALDEALGANEEEVSGWAFSARYRTVGPPGRRTNGPPRRPTSNPPGSPTGSPPGQPTGGPPGRPTGSPPGRPTGGRTPS